MALSIAHRQRLRDAGQVAHAKPAYPRFPAPPCDDSGAAPRSATVAAPSSSNDVPPRGDASQQMLVLCIGISALYVVLGIVAWVLR